MRTQYFEPGRKDHPFINVYMRAEYRDWLREQAKETGKSVAAIIREALDGMMAARGRESADA